MFGACVVSLVLSACGSGGGGLETGSSSIEESGLAIAEVTESVPRTDLALARQANSKTEAPSTSTASSSSSGSSTSGSSTSSTSSTAQAITTSANYVDTMISDMRLFHDGPSAVLASLKGWGSGASWPESTPRPAGWQYAIPWSHTMADTDSANGDGYPWRVPGPYTGNQAPNTRVQQRDVQMWWLLSNGQWVLGSHNPRPGKVMYPLHWAEGTEKSGTDIWRDESANGGGASMRSIGLDAYSKHLWHAWASPNQIPSNAIGAATAFFARLILDNPSGPDDRRRARILSAGSGDWYKDTATLTSSKVQGQNVIYMGFGRLKYVKNEWQMFSWTNLTEAQLRANPPPFIGMPK